jgi:hypothetical protein
MIVCPWVLKNPKYIGPKQDYTLQDFVLSKRFSVAYFVLYVQTSTTVTDPSDLDHSIILRNKI